MTKTFSLLSGVPSTFSCALLEEHDWCQCKRFYTFQPIYRTSGILMAIELLTVISHPSVPDKRVSPEVYFTVISIEERLKVVREQLELVGQWHALFVRHALLVSINIDGQTLLAMQSDAAMKQLISQMPYVRFELLEHPVTALHHEFHPQIEQNHLLWLDDFGCGVANFSSVNSWRYEYIKFARGLFTMLGDSKEGEQLFYQLVTMMNRYSKGVIVEGIETEREWAMVQRSDACAAQGYFLSKPKHVDMLHAVPIEFLTGQSV